MVENTSAEIRGLLDAAISAADELGKRTGFDLEYAHIEDALIDKLGLDDATDLLGRALTTEQIIGVLQDYDFRKLFPEILDEIRLDHSIVAAGIRHRLIEVTVRFAGEVWRIHKNDSDPFPSKPHGHNLQTGHKLHLGTGELFLRKRCVGKIHKKDLEEIRTRLAKHQLPPLEV